MLHHNADLTNAMNIGYHNGVTHKTRFEIVGPFIDTNSII